jgi:hypothetical protein
VHDDPVFMRRVNGWPAARVEVNQQREAQRLAEMDPAGDVVEALVERTSIEAAPA